MLVALGDNGSGFGNGKVNGLPMNLHWAMYLSQALACMCILHWSWHWRVSCIDVYNAFGLELALMCMVT